MALPKARTALFIAVPLAILLLPVTIYLLDRSFSGGEVARNVSASGISLAGLGEEDARLAVLAYEAELRSGPAVFVVNGSQYELDPSVVGLDIDEEAVVAEAMSQGRNGGAFARFRSWLDSFRTPIDLEVPVALDAAAIDAQLLTWDEEAIPNPAYEGDLRLEGGVVVVEYPRVGETIDREQSQQIMQTVLTAGERGPVRLPLTESSPVLTDADLEAAAGKANDLIDSGVTLRNNELGLVLYFDAAQLVPAARITFDPDDPDLVELSLDPTVIGRLVAPRQAQFELEPVNASCVVDAETDEVTVIPSKNGTLLDVTAVAEAVEKAALGVGYATFDLAVGPEPQFTTAAAEAMGPIEKVSEFTTKHACCANRVHNIHLMADTVDGAVVWPGETFSVNDHVGQRTTAAGYLRDGAIIDGELHCCDDPANVGGGVSQFGTTIYNAIFFGCYEDVEHQPHSLYFSRYPEGREATLGFPKPDVIFRNNTAAPAIIKTQYTSTSITVKFYGNNGGKVCTSRASERFGHYSARKEIVADETGTVAPGEEVTLSKGGTGWSISIWRTVNLPDGTSFEEEPFTWRYRPRKFKVAVHPCTLSDAVVCPVQVPGGLGGLTYGDAAASITAAGLVPTQSQVEVGDPAQNGLVQSTAPGGGTWVDPGATVTVTVGVYTGD